MGKIKTKKRAPYTPPTTWDAGPNTAAQRAGRVVEDVTETDPATGKRVNPNAVKRARRIDMAESYHKQGLITERQMKAAIKLREAYEATMRGPAAIKAVQVDSSPKPDQHIAITIDRVSKFIAISRHIPQPYEGIVKHVAIDNRSIGSMYKGRLHAKGVLMLREGLDLLADAMGM